MASPTQLVDAIGITYEETRANVLSPDGETEFFKITTGVLQLRTGPTIVTAYIFYACQGSRARRERNAQHTEHADWFCLL